MINNSKSSLLLVSVFFFFRWVLTLALLILNISVVNSILSTEIFPIKEFIYLVLVAILRLVNNGFIGRSVEFIKKGGQESFSSVMKIAPILADTSFILIVTICLLFLSPHFGYLLFFYSVSAVLYPYLLKPIKYFDYLYVAFYLILLIALHLYHSGSVEISLISLITVSICFLPLRGLVQWKSIITPSRKNIVADSSVQKPKH